MQPTYHQALGAISLAIHPFNYCTGEWQLWQALELHLMAPLRELEHLCRQLNLVKGLEAVETFQKQIPSLALRLADLVARGSYRS